MHICKECGETDLSKFGVHSVSKKPHGYCRKCRNERYRETSKRYYSSGNGKEVKAKSDKKYYTANKNKILTYNKEYRDKNKEKISENKRMKYLLNKEEILLKLSIYKKNNKDKVNKLSAKRRAKKLKASPDWGELNDLIIEEAYSLAKDRTELTNLVWHVDHIIPLNNPLVCGLHVGINLQVIPAIDNLRKSNKVSL